MKDMVTCVFVHFHVWFTKWWSPLRKNHTQNKHQMLKSLKTVVKIKFYAIFYPWEQLLFARLFQGLRKALLVHSLSGPLTVRKYAHALLPVWHLYWKRKGAQLDNQIHFCVINFVYLTQTGWGCSSTPSTPPGYAPGIAVADLSRRLCRLALFTQCQERKLNLTTTHPSNSSTVAGKANWGTGHNNRST